MQIAIVDNITDEQKLLCSWLEHQLNKRNVHADLFEYENGEAFLAAAKKQCFTVLFLAIWHMPHPFLLDCQSGISTANVASFNCSL